jgi:hypothetical protein
MDKQPWSLRKGVTHINVQHGHSDSALFATDAKFVEGPPIAIMLDLETNLRTRSKTSGTYIDAKKLAEEIDTLKRLEVHDGGIVDRLRHHLQYTKDQKTPWQLALNLQGEHKFAVEPEFRGANTLVFKVV